MDCSVTQPGGGGGKLLPFRPEKCRFRLLGGAILCQSSSENLKAPSCLAQTGNIAVFDSREDLTPLLENAVQHA
jgi:hypothetical protein